MTFDDALQYFEDSSVDILHIDGLHTYEAARHDFESWQPKLSERAIVLFHDIEVADQSFGVAKLWNDLLGEYDGIDFRHNNGLGVLLVGEDRTEAVKNLLCDYLSPTGNYLVRLFFERLGARFLSEIRAGELELQLRKSHATLVEVNDYVSTIRTSYWWKFAAPIRMLEYFLSRKVFIK
jgi:hypothetical protein